MDRRITRGGEARPRGFTFSLDIEESVQKNDVYCRELMGKATGCLKKLDPRRCFQKEEKENRRIHLNPINGKQEDKFRGNQVYTNKYNPILFPIQELAEQFTRAANLYFVLITILASIPQISPLSPYSNAPPLLFVLGVTMLKDAVEDFFRAKSDLQTNNSKCKVLVNGEWKLRKWKHLKVGDVVRVEQNKPFPADLIALSSSLENGVAFIETANLDGETNLKNIESIRLTSEAVEAPELSELQGFLVTEPPNENLHKFKGTIQAIPASSGRARAQLEESLSMKNFCPRSTVLKNTEFLNGVVIYTGKDTKLMMNATAAPFKSSDVERIMNIQIITLLCVHVMFAVIAGVGAAVFYMYDTDDHWYLFDSNISEGDAAEEFVLRFFTFWILFNTFIPISLYVSLETVKVIQAMFMKFDIRMWHEETDTAMKPRTTKLNEELGQVTHVFSDKTGTLTQNRMVYVRSSIGGEIYGKYPWGAAKTNTKGELAEIDSHADFDNTLAIERMADRKHPHSGALREFFSLLAVCHSVIPEENDKGEMEYNAQSPDEAATVGAAKHVGYYFYKRTPTSVIIATPEGDQSYDVLRILEFNSTRKRMSVIARCPDGSVKLFCKGADNMIIPRLDPQDKEKPRYTDIESMTGHLEEFASIGLRTLTCAAKVIPPKEYEEWDRRYHAAAVSSGDDREAKMDVLAEEIEQGMTLVGATAIEDKLQDGVPNAIATLLRAGIRVCVLTGDKQETAINIGHSCSLLRGDMELLIVNDFSWEGTKEQLERARSIVEGDVKREKDYALIIDGPTLEFGLQDSLKMNVLWLLENCTSIVCCRVSPLQKSLVVRLVKDNIFGSITLAIGDGGNDVSMIQAAHLGVGISGNEGMQAVRAADYAIAQFRFLTRLLLVHGLWSYKRVSMFIAYSFYKNVAFTLVHFWFSIFSGFSGQKLVEDLVISNYNVLFTCLPIMVFGLFNQDVTARYAERFPELYEDGRKKKYFSLRVLWGWVLVAMFHSAILYFIPHLVHMVPTDMDGYDNGLWGMGLFVFTATTIVVNLKLALYVSTWNWLMVFAFVFSVTAWFWVVPLYSFYYIRTIYEDYWYLMRLFIQPSLWVTTLLVVVVALLGDFVWAWLKRSEFESHLTKVQDLQRKGHLRKRTKRYRQVMRKMRTAADKVELGPLSPRVLVPKMGSVQGQVTPDDRDGVEYNRGSAFSGAQGSMRMLQLYYGSGVLGPFKADGTTPKSPGLFGRKKKNKKSERRSDVTDSETPRDATTPGGQMGGAPTVIQMPDESLSTPTPRRGFFGRKKGSSADRSDV